VRALTPWLAGLGVPERAAGPLALAAVILAITYLSLVVGELVPKALALRDPERAASLVAPVIASVSRASSVLVRALTASTTAVLRVLGLGAVTESPFVSEEEVRYLVREGVAKGIFEKVEAELVQRVFEFADTTVREVMVPRPNIRGLEVATPPSEVLRAASEVGHSRVPVYRGSIENPAGVLLMKDLIRAVAAGGAPVLAELARPALFVPESARVSALLREFQRSRQNLALVVDEYGLVVGLVTIEDVLEEIVGEIRDEGESAIPAFATRLAGGAWVLDGLAPVRDVRAQLGIPVPESDDYQTIAGFLLYTLDTIPSPGASVTVGSHRYTVVDVDGPKISRVKVERDQRR
jgi:putative hemolysin